MNTELRKQASSDFEQDFFKLMNNSVFGKTVENFCKRINVHLVKGVNEINKLRGGFKTQPPVDRRFRPVSGGCHC